LKKIGDLVQDADWKAEKHVPVIECADAVKSDEFFEIKVAVGKEIAHPNTTEHHIAWTSLFFHPHEEKFPCQIARFEFGAHGASVQGPRSKHQFCIYTSCGNDLDKNKQAGNSDRCLNVQHPRAMAIFKRSQAAVAYSSFIQEFSRINVLFSFFFVVFLNFKLKFNCFTIELYRLWRICLKASFLYIVVNSVR